ncbi:sigma-70 family RNA polymerase sigma factor [Enterococcus hermanniensis]|uniref:RNA polymerase sigma factor SigS n=1 Tax=Enterococcus hermanniensis TaxID=249189 RepID=A0A1L8TG56_9ENTE|nr:sigma-70 family RNA polymerase sigma factor [Enterococcus hermanniensis]OJG43325.1 hypothetical protein RV04_GL000685 [Enterococcus hermanniensis]
MEKPESSKKFDDEFEAMFSKYLPVVYKMQSRYLIRDYDFDDWLQEGRIALNDAMQSYQKGRGTTFGLYYKMIFENRIRSLLRRQQAQKRLAQQHAVSIEKVGQDSFSEQFQYQEQIEENLYICELLSNDTLALSTLETLALHYYLRGEEPKDIALRLAESEKVVRNAINRTKNKLKRILYQSNN